MPRVLLLLPSSTYRAGAFLAAAERLGVEIVTASEERQALSSQMGDRFLQIDIDRAEQGAAQICELSDRVGLDAVIGVDDRGALTAAIAARSLGLVSNQPDAVAATLDKSLLRRRLRDAGVPQPPYAPIEAGEDRVERAGTAAAIIGYPVVVKPISLSASRGVIRSDNAAELEAAICRIENILAGCGRSGEEILIERFIPGREVAVEGLLQAGRFEPLATFDKPDPLDGPYFEETIYVTPSHLPPGEQRAVIDLVGNSCAALGLSEGPVHGEVRLEQLHSGTFPILVEIAARTIGGRCSSVLHFEGDVSLEELVIARSLGREVNVPPLEGSAGVMMLPIPAAGRLLATHGRERALAVPGIVDLEIAIGPGQLVVPLPEGERYLGFLFARGGDSYAVEAALREAHARLEFEIEPVVEPRVGPRR